MILTEAHKDALRRLLGDRVVFDQPLAGHTTFGLGGPAWALVRPDDVEELARLLAFLKSERLPWFVLGGGSNVLCRDGGFNGVIVRLGEGFSGLDLEETEDGSRRLAAGAAASTAKMVSLCRREGLSGLEFMAGIPGTVGGALAMNAGTRRGAAGDALVRMEVMDAGGMRRVFERAELCFGYRRLGLAAGTIIVRGIFHLVKTGADEVEAAVREVLEQRSSTQPKGVRSAGCVFRNPPGDSAGRLIDRAGLKGSRRGGAWVAEEHANFIVHDGRASAADVLGLLDTVRSTVLERFGVELEPEIVILGQNGKPEEQ